MDFDDFSETSRSRFDFTQFTDWFGDGEEVDYYKVVLPDVPKPQEGACELARLPSDIFHLVTNLLPAQDVFMLWCTGSRPIQTIMSYYGGIASLNLTISFDRSVGLPAFPGYLNKLRSISMIHEGRKECFVKGIYSNCDVQKWPSSLESITLACSDPLRFFYNQDFLAHTYEIQELPARAENRVKARWIACSSQISLPDPSTFFYDLKILFPRLTSLILTHDLNNYMIKSYRYHNDPFLQLRNRTALHLNMDGSPREVESEDDVDEYGELLEDSEDNIISETALIQSLPPSLTVCHFGFNHVWLYESLIHLPPSVIDLELDSVTSIVWNSQGRDEPDIPEEAIDNFFAQFSLENSGIDVLWKKVDSGNETAKKIHQTLESIPPLPPGILSLKVNRPHLSSPSTLIFKLPSALTCLDIENNVEFPAWIARSLPSSLKTLKVPFEPTDEPQWIAALPRSLTVLHCEEAIFGKNILWGDNEMDVALRYAPAFPPSVTELLVTVTITSSLACLFATISCLPLEKLLIGTQEDSQMEDKITKKMASSLPATLRVLQIGFSEISVDHDAWACLPKNLTTLKLIDSEYRISPHRMSLDQLPESLTELGLSCARSSISPVSWPPRLTKLHLSINNNPNGSLESRRQAMMSLFMVKPAPSSGKSSPAVEPSLNRKQRKRLAKLKRNSSRAYPESSVPTIKSKVLKATSSSEVLPSPFIRSYELGRLLPPTLTSLTIRAVLPRELAMALPRGLTKLSLTGTDRDPSVPAAHLPRGLLNLKLILCWVEPQDWAELPRGLTRLRMPGSFVQPARYPVTTINVALTKRKSYARTLPRSLTKLQFDRALGWTPQLIETLPRTLHKVRLVDADYSIRHSETWPIQTLFQENYAH